jgi:DNA invertase Pin-like site-specific DNA recombinase
VEIKSYTQPYLDTSNSSIRELLLAFFSYIANFQLKRYSEDIKSGQKRALAQGKRIGRPKISSSTKELIAEFKSKNISNRNIARELKISEKTVRNYLFQAVGYPATQDRCFPVGTFPMFPGRHWLLSVWLLFSQADK